MKQYQYILILILCVLFTLSGCEICEECNVCPDCPTPDPIENPFEWEGTTIIPDNLFLNPENWAPNGSTIDERSTAFGEDGILKITWEFEDGVRAKWVQRYITLPGAISFAEVDIVAFDIQAGKAHYTCGPGEPGGLDGIIPLAVWYEGTLSYICADGPGSSFLFDNVVNYINADGTVSHYNDNFGAIGGVWAVDWHSLDGTS